MCSVTMSSSLFLYRPLRSSGVRFQSLVGGHGIEPWTSFLSGKRSTTELPALFMQADFNTTKSCLPTDRLQIAKIHVGFYPYLRTNLIHARNLESSNVAVV